MNIGAHGYFLLFCLFDNIILSIGFHIGGHAGYQKRKFKVVKQNSFLRKVLPFFKDAKDRPLLYVKIVPIFIWTVLFLLALVLYAICWMCPNSVLISILESFGCFIMGICVLLAQVIYLTIIIEMSYRPNKKKKKLNSRKK